MDANKVDRLSGNIDNLGDLPDGLKVAVIFYSNDKYEGFYIPEAMRENLAAVSSKDSNGKDVTYLIYCNVGAKDNVKQKLRTIIVNYRKDDIEIPLIIAETNQLVLIEGLNTSFINSFTKKSKVKSNEKTEDASALAEKILYAAMRVGASDLHIESDGKRAKVRFRRNKELGIYTTLTHAQADEFGSVCYGTFVKGDGEGQEKGTGRGVYQSGNLLEGEFSRVIGDVNLKARMVNIGHNQGKSFDLVMRLIDKNKSNNAQRFEDLDFSKNSCTRLRRLETLSRGMVLTVGVTGSGKSTSQQNMLQQERDRTGGSRKILSIEHPVEAVVDGVSQITAGEKKESSDQNFSFENLNTLFMRADPDSIAYGEIRDQATAEASIKGVESGHLVYGTMHASECMGVFSRFESFGVSIDKVCRKGFLRVVLFQHLLPRLCKHCSKPHVIGDAIPNKYDEIFAVKSLMASDSKKHHLQEFLDIQDTIKPNASFIRELQRRGIVNSREVILMKRKLEYMNSESDSESFSKRLARIASGSMLGSSEINVRFRGQGCKHCFQGYKGVTPSSEVLIPDDEFLHLVRDGQMDKAELYWKTNLQGKSATSDTYDKILSGVVDPRTVEEELEDLGS
jgi:type II secretory ATPase GspE/PulE/Tfp pilus assembly ATPase PilB-like protein